MPNPPLQLNKGEERRLRSGHLWVFSNEINVRRTPLTPFTAGDPVTVVSHAGVPLGSAYVNPGSLICARLISRKADLVLDKALLQSRLQRALALREQLFPEPYYRLAFGESDYLPGLVVDRYGAVLVVQITTAGMERQRTSIIEALQELLHPTGILFKNDGNIRTLEGLERYVETGTGTVPERLAITENNVHFTVPIVAGQKTGWFFDHRLNRKRMQAYVADARVLDVFSYIGGWGIQAAACGATAVTCIDVSDSALQLAQANAAQNNCAGKITLVQEDAFVALKRLQQAGARFEVVILDPPAFIKRKKDLKEGLTAYRRLNQAALQLLTPGGVLISASCSYHLSASMLVDTLRRSAQSLGVELQLLEQGHQAPDHPIHPAIPETDYIKCFVCRTVPGS